MWDQTNRGAALKFDRSIAKDGLYGTALVGLHRLHLVEGVLHHVLMREDALMHRYHSTIGDDNVRHGLSEELGEEPVMRDQKEKERCDKGSVREPHGMVRAQPRKHEQEHADTEKYDIQEHWKCVLDPVFTHHAQYFLAVGRCMSGHIR